MNRWWGTSEDSAKQSASRAQRAARRTLNSLHLHLSDEENFEDANSTLNTSSLANLNLDGGGDETSETNSTVDTVEPDLEPEHLAAMVLTADELAAEKLKTVQDANYPDDSEAWKKELKVKFDRHDVTYWLNTSESDMKKYGINSQWSKKSALVSMLPDDVIEELKPILRLSEEDQGPHIYKDLRQELLLLFGPRDEDAFKKAIALRLTGRPSALGKRLTHIICPGARPFRTCHCARIVYGFWEAQLTAPIKTALTGKRFTADSYEEIFKLADEAWLHNGGASLTSPAVVAATTHSTSSSSAPSTSVSSPEAVAAVVRGGRGGRSNRGNRGARGNRGNNRGGRGNSNNSNSQNYNNTSSNQNQNGPLPHQKGPKASADVPANACSQHWKAGRNATYCSDPLNCDWVQIIAPRAPRQT